MVNISLDDNASVIVWNTSAQLYTFVHKGQEIDTITLREILHHPDGKTPTKVIIEWVAACKQKAAMPNGGQDGQQAKPKRFIEVPRNTR